MGLLRSLLTLPVTGPPKAGWWVLEQVVHAAEEELYDEGRIAAELRALSAQVEAGEITEEEHAAQEEALLQRLVEARRYHAAREGTA
jgi:hypothetical protein